MITDPVDLFSQTVPESHARFLEAAADLDVEVFTHPLTGPADEPLQTSVARLGPAKARNVILSISGVHGLEGFAGSALQVGALRSRAELLDLGPDMAIVFVHQLNPWGAPHGGARKTRTTRNCCATSTTSTARVRRTRCSRPWPK